MASTTTMTVSSCVAPRRMRVVCAASTPPTAPKARWGVPFLVAGVAAAQLAIFPANPAMAYDAQPSIDFVSEANVADVISELEDQEIPQLEVRLGAVSMGNKESKQVLAAAQTQLDSIENEAASLAEKEERSGPTADIAQETSGLLNEITSLKSMLRGM